MENEYNNALNTIKKYESLENIVNESLSILKWYNDNIKELDGGYTNYFFDRIEGDNEGTWVRFEIYHCGDTDSFYLPLEVFFMSEEGKKRFAIKEKKRLTKIEEERKRKFQEARLQAEINGKKEIEEKEKKLYLKLKEKYGDK